MKIHLLLLPALFLLLSATTINTRPHIEQSAEAIHQATSLFDLISDFATAECSDYRYALTLVPHKKDPISMNHHGSTFSNRARQFLQSVKAKDYLYIEQIHGHCSGQERQLRSYTIQIK